MHFLNVQRFFAAKARAEAALYCGRLAASVQWLRAYATPLDRFLSAERAGCDSIVCYKCGNRGQVSRQCYAARLA
jgi:hypothetical protein